VQSHGSMHTSDWGVSRLVPSGNAQKRGTHCRADFPLLRNFPRVLNNSA
jgi:hypothetical protein